MSSFTGYLSQKQHDPLSLLMQGVVFPLLLVGLTLSVNPLTLAAQKSQNFLPPVALINDTMTLGQLEGKISGENEDLGPVVFSAVSPAVKLTPKATNLQAIINVQSENPEYQTLLSMQKRLDEEDLNKLWESTVEKNPVIRFSLEKLATPVDLHTRQSSRFLNKTLSAMLSGAAMGLMMVPGGGAYQNMGITTVTQAAQNIITGNNKPQVITLSPTEQIQLAGLIDDLKSQLVQNYHNYKKTLEQLTQARAVTLRNNNLYAKALRSNNPLAKMAAGSAYYKANLNENDLRQRAQLHRLRLERLAGHDAVDNLQLAFFIDSDSPTQNAQQSKPRQDTTTAAGPSQNGLPDELDTPLELHQAHPSDIIGPSPQPKETNASGAIMQPQQGTLMTSLSQPSPLDPVVSFEPTLLQEVTP